MINKIIFFDETTIPNKTGGTIRIQELLTKEFIGCREVIIIGTKNGSVINKLLNDKVKFRFIEQKQELVEKYISTNDLVIVFWMNTAIKILKKTNPYILFWNVYPFLSSMNFLRRFRYHMFIKEMYNKNSFSVMDAECKKTILKKFKIDIRSDYLRIPVNIFDKSYKYKVNKNINITYIGRGDVNALWKIKPLVKIVKDLAKIEKIDFKIHIFTDFSELFEKELENYTAKNIEVKFYFGYWSHTLSQKLLELSDVHYSMGTAMLDGAKLGIPTIIADAGWNDFPNNYKYRWFIYDVENYAGRFIDNLTEFGGLPIETIVNDVLDKEKMLDISVTQYNIVKKTFSSQKISEQILLLNPKGKVRDIIKYFPKMYFKHN